MLLIAFRVRWTKYSLMMKNSTASPSIMSESMAGVPTARCIAAQPTVRLANTSADTAMPMGRFLPSCATMMAVKPQPPVTPSIRRRCTPVASNAPAMPAKPPETIMDSTMTDVTGMPA